MTVPPGQLSGSAALDVDAVDWTEVENLLKDAYRMTAPKRLVAKLEICQRITT